MRVKENCCGEETIVIEDSDFCQKCKKWIGKYYTLCDECRKTPVTFADGLTNE